MRSRRSNSVQLRITAMVVCLVLLPPAALAVGGVQWIAGASEFNPGLAGTPVTWANGSVLYFTDQGDLSPLLPQDGANAFVADAFLRWTAVPTAALSATRGGTLAEDVSGSNVSNPDGTVTPPMDLQPTATNKPLGIVYDADGAVTDALLGNGASDPAFCSSNSVFGGVDAFSTDGHIVHAVVVLNGRCAQNSSDLPPLKYRLVRMLGHVLGLGWSQVNDQVRTGSPPPTTDDFMGFPLMHALDPVCNQAITNCIPNADQLRMDDRAAISYLYPVTQGNIANFPGKQLFFENTIRIHGSVFFSGPQKMPGQPMQGVNVVARLVDPATGKLSPQMASASVSGFRFRGNAGNDVSGFLAPSGQRLDAFGSNDTALEGEFDLSGLELPAGISTASYQLSVEAVNPLYVGESTVGPYRVATVRPSGSFAPVVIAGLTAGANVTHDITMSGSARIIADTAEPNSFTSPSPVPRNGEWTGSLSGYGDADFFSFSARASRSFTLQVTSLDESGSVKTDKALPMLGLWLATDQPGAAPLLTANSFNTAVTGLTELKGILNQSGNFKFGIADFRGDGRPDFLYRARILYADNVTPSRVSSQSASPVILRGLGFRPGMSITVGGVSANILSMNESEAVIATPPFTSGSQTITVQEAATGAASSITGALTFGGAVGDQLIPLTVPNPQTPVGANAPNPIRVRVVSSDGVTPIAGVPVGFSVTPIQSTLSPCGVSNCSIISDASGEAATTLTVKAAGTNTATIALSTGAAISSTVAGTLPPLTVVAVPPSTFLTSGTSTMVPLRALVLSQGSPLSGQTLNYQITLGSAALANSSATTGTNGEAVDMVTVTNLNEVIVAIACLATGSPCAQFQIKPVATAELLLQKVSGDRQILTVGQSAQPVTLRVTDSSPGANRVPNVAVTFSYTVLARPGPRDCNIADGICRPAMLRALGAGSATVISDSGGVVSFTPTVQAQWGAATLSGTATVGSATWNFEVQIVAP